MAEAQQTLHEAIARATAQLDCPRTLLVLSTLSATNAVKEQIRAKGLRLSQFTCADIRSAADDYLNEHVDLIEQAAQTVRSHPKLRTLAEREARDRRRNRQ
jgi:hypothetical protein